MTAQSVDKRPDPADADERVRKTIRSLMGWYGLNRNIDPLVRATGITRTKLYARMKGEPFRNGEVALIAWAFGLTPATIYSPPPQADLPVSPPIVRVAQGESIGCLTAAGRRKRAAGKVMPGQRALLPALVRAMSG